MHDQSGVGSAGLAKVEQRLSDGSLKSLTTLFGQLGLASHFAGDAVLYGADAVIRSPHRLGEASGVAQLLIGIAAAAIWRQRAGQETDVAIDILDALHFLHPTHFVQQQGRSINIGAEYVAVNDLFRCRDGRYLMLEAGPPYVKLLPDCRRAALSLGKNGLLIRRAKR
jgi:crotonobetainyl-CoA:carnitine CoA-transferase CaiB-like acyl-CoA transferase